VPNFIEFRQKEVFGTNSD